MKKRKYKNEKGESFTFSNTSKQDIEMCLSTIPGHWKAVTMWESPVMFWIILILLFAIMSIFAIILKVL